MAALCSVVWGRAGSSLWQSSSVAQGVRRSLHVSSCLQVRRPKVEIREEKYPGAFDDHSVATYSFSNGWRRVEPPDWNARAYKDGKGWFHEWLMGRNVGDTANPMGRYYPQSRKEYHELQDLIQEARDRLFGSYPPKPLDWEYTKRVFHFCVKADAEEWLDEVFETMHNHYIGEADYDEIKAKYYAYKNQRLTDRWDS